MLKFVSVFNSFSNGLGFSFGCKVVVFSKLRCFVLMDYSRVPPYHYNSLFYTYLFRATVE